MIVKDSGLITITKVATSNNLRFSKIYISFIGNTKKPNALVDLMNENISEYRYNLGKALKLKYIPEIRFYYDSTFEEMENILEADCPASGGFWVIFAWNDFINTFASDMSVTFADNGTFTSVGFIGLGEEGGGTWVLDGSTLTLTVDGEVNAATVSGYTITFELIDEAEDNCTELVLSSLGG